MLHEFLHANRDELVSRCRAKAAKRNPALASSSQYGIPKFLDQLINVFRLEHTADASVRHRAVGRGRPSLALVPSDIAGTASKHGAELQQLGATFDQVVHDYGDLCQALTELAMEKDQPISVDEFHTFNRCSDDAIADAVSAFAKAQLAASVIEDVDATGAGNAAPGERMRFLVEAALNSLAAIKTGQVALQGATARMHEDSLLELRDLLGRAFGDEPRNARTQG